MKQILQGTLVERVPARNGEQGGKMWFWGKSYLASWQEADRPGIWSEVSRGSYQVSCIARPQNTHTRAHTLAYFLRPCGIFCTLKGDQITGEHKTPPSCTHARTHTHLRIVSEHTICCLTRACDATHALTTAPETLSLISSQTECAKKGGKKKTVFFFFLSPCNVIQQQQQQHPWVFSKGTSESRYRTQTLILSVKMKMSKSGMQCVGDGDTAQWEVSENERAKKKKMKMQIIVLPFWQKWLDWWLKYFQRAS